MGKKSQRERREILEQMEQKKPQPCGWMNCRNECKNAPMPPVSALPVIAANPNRAWWQRLFGP